MTLQELQNALSTIKKGRYIKVIYQDQNNGYVKTTMRVVRLVKYANIKGVQVANKSNPNETQTNEFIYYNANTNKYYLQVALTKNHNKATIMYEFNGIAIDQATYELAIPPKKHYGNVSPVIRLTIDKIISIG